MIRLSPALVQPIASDDVAAALADLAVGPPVNGTVEVAGPETFPLDQLARKFLAASDDSRQVIADVHARYYGAELNDRSLTPGDHPRIGATRFDDWLSHSVGSQLGSGGRSTTLRTIWRSPPMVIDRLGSTTSARLVAITAAETIQAAAVALSDPNIGLLVVCDEAGRAVGVLSKSDLVRHLADAGPAGAPLAPAMTTKHRPLCPGR